MDKLTPFEHEAIATLVGGDHPVFEGLRAQLDRCEVSERVFTGVGFFTDLVVPPDVPTLSLRRRLHLGDASVAIDGVAAGLVLFVEEGRLALLEGFTYDDPWPDAIVNYTIEPGGVTHGGGSQTDIEQVDAAWVRPDALT